MTDQEFAAILLREIVDNNVTSYRQNLEMPPDQVKDPYYKAAQALYQSLGYEQKAVLVSVMRQVAVDSLSNVLGILDGVCGVDGLNEQLTLVDESGAKLNGDLQDYFLELIEEAELEGEKA